MTSRYLSSLSKGISENIDTGQSLPGREAPLYTPLHTPHKKNIKKHKKTLKNMYCHSLTP